MGYIGSGTDNLSNLLFFDIETAPMAGAADWIEPGEAPANYKDAEKIRAYIEAAQVRELEKAALDLDLCRIVAIGWAHNDDSPLSMFGEDERKSLTEFWGWVREAGRTVVGFNCLGFDLPVLVRRSQYLGVPVPYLNVAKHRHPGIIDMMQVLSFDGLVRPRSQAFYCRRFGITVGADDTVTGADIGRLVEASDWEAVHAHVCADVAKTRALYHRATGAQHDTL